jgi:endo-1,4-beta-D-glucanase Y
MRLATLVTFAFTTLACGAGTGTSRERDDPACGECAGGAPSAGGSHSTGGVGAGANSSGATAGAEAGSGAGASDSGGSGQAGSGANGNGPSELYGSFPSSVSEADGQAAYDTWYDLHVEECDATSARVKWDNPSKTVSEGIGYGMLLAAIWEDDPGLLSRFWQYYQIANNENGLMGWMVNGCTSQVDDPGSASDGDLDAAMGLVLGHCRWSDQGFDTAAVGVMHAIKSHEVINVNTGPNSGRLALIAGDNWGGTHCINPSYHSPAYYRVFANLDAANENFWNQLASDTYLYLDEEAHATTGLVGEWAEADGSCNFGSQNVYGYNAARTPWRIATDYAWHGDADALALLGRIADWVEDAPNGIDGETGIAGVGDGYITDGTRTGGNHHSTFVGAFALSGLVGDAARSDAFHEEFVNIPAENDSGYFQSTLRALYLSLALEKFAPSCAL